MSVHEPDHEPDHDGETAMPTFDTPEPIHALIDVAGATIRIHAGERADTVVEVRPSDEFDDADVQAARHTQIDYAGGRLLVRLDRGGSDSGWSLSLDKLVESPATWARSLLLGWEGSVEVTVHLPAGSRVEAKTAKGLYCHGPLGDLAFATSYGDISVEQAGRVRLKTAHGHVSLDRAAGFAEITTTNGDIRVGTVDGPAVVKTSHGQLRIGEVTGELRLNSAYGDITVDRARAGVAAKTAYGSVRIGEVARGAVVMETTGGGLDLGIREGSAAWLDVSSRYGLVDVGLDSTEGPGSSEDVVEVRAHTAYGDIRIRRS
ncbi:DUF4097 domain-containing protein [Actinomadura sp. ATCC 31491]|uniref:DUF4097 domain-containing protein n=1 Tax=Actinomadura luzonensis TaxID=2805427 RepID=A0ABT0FJ26_9ACTN|nr:DUF4097 family beta strand repeat-containing protein [Actinomadura luzonensis]MCK2212305.1 DUF4097 domain-containing protein [Actinomadura luzonensis]